MQSSVRLIFSHSIYLSHFLDRYGYTIRSYFQFIMWLFYLNIFTFILCFTCIIMPTYIYPDPVNFSTYTMREYYRLQHKTYNDSSSECKLIDPECQILSSNNYSDGINTCLSNSYRASSCCSLLTEERFVNSSQEGERDWKEFLLDLTDGTVKKSYIFLFLFIKIN